MRRKIEPARSNGVVDGGGKTGMVECWNSGMMGLGAWGLGLGTTGVVEWWCFGSGRFGRGIVV